LFSQFYSKQELKKLNKTPKQLGHLYEINTKSSIIIGLFYNLIIAQDFLHMMMMGVSYMFLLVLTQLA